MDGAIHLAKALRLGTCRNSLQSLNLARCNIGFEGCRHIAGALLVNSSITELDLSGSNFISVEGAMQLALAVVHNTTLEWLGVGNHNLHVKCLRGKISVADLKKQQKLYRRRQEQQSTIAHQTGDDSKLYLAPSTSVVSNSSEEDQLAVMALHRVMENKPILRCGTKDEDMSTWEFWGVDLEHKATWGARQSSLRDLAAMLDAEDLTNSRVEDETAIVIAHLLSHNRLHEYVNIEEGVLPLQKLNGIPNEFHLDLANMKLTSCDAIVIGKLVAENSVAKTIELQGNNFAATEGENWIAYALNRNTSMKIDTLKWSSEAMYTDGYKALAALNGTSASGLAIEPQRLDGYFYKLVVMGGGIMFYVATFSDIYTIIIYSDQPDVYNSSWVYLGALFICLPSFLIIMVTILSLGQHDPVATLKKVLIVLFQLSKAVETFKSCLNSYESADCKLYSYMYVYIYICY